MMNRRKYLSAIGVATGTVLAGCSGTDNGGDSGGSNSGGSGSTESGGEGTETESKTATQSASSTQATTSEETSTTETETSTSASGSTEGSAEVSDTELVINEGEYSTDVFMTGLVENTGEGVLRVPEARVSFYDSEDSILDSSTVSLAFLKEDTQWEIHEPYFDETQPTRGEIEVTNTEIFQTELGIPDGLELVEDSLRGGEEPSMSIQIRNTSDSSVSPTVFAVFYDGDGIALGDAYDILDELPPGESWQTSLDYTAYSTQDPQRVSDYDLYANLL